MAIQPTLSELQVQMAGLTVSVATISLQLKGLLAQQQQQKAHVAIVLPISEPKTTPASESASSNTMLVDLAGCARNMFDEISVKGKESYDETNITCAIQGRATPSKKLRLKAPTTWKRRKKLRMVPANYIMESINLAHFNDGRSLSPTSLICVVPSFLMFHAESDLVMLEEDKGSGVTDKLLDERLEQKAKFNVNAITTNMVDLGLIFGTRGLFSSRKVLETFGVGMNQEHTGNVAHLRHRVSTIERKNIAPKTPVFAEQLSAQFLKLCQFVFSSTKKVDMFYQVTCDFDGLHRIDEQFVGLSEPLCLSSFTSTLCIVCDTTFTTMYVSSNLEILMWIGVGKLYWVGMLLTGLANGVSTLLAMKQKGELVDLQVTEFEVCNCDKGIDELVVYGADFVGHTVVVCCFIQRAPPTLFLLLPRILLTQNEEEYQDAAGWSISMVGICLGLVAQTVRVDVILLVKPVVKDKVSTSAWMQRSKDLYAFGFVFEDQFSAILMTLVSRTSRFVLNTIMETSVITMKGTKGWILEMISELLSGSAYEILTITKIKSPQVITILLQSMRQNMVVHVGEAIWTWNYLPVEHNLESFLLSMLDNSILCNHPSQYIVVPSVKKVKVEPSMCYRASMVTFHQPSSVSQFVSKMIYIAYYCLLQYKCYMTGTNSPLITCVQIAEAWTRNLSNHLLLALIKALPSHLMQLWLSIMSGISDTEAHLPYLLKCEIFHKVAQNFLEDVLHVPALHAGSRNIVSVVMRIASRNEITPDNETNIDFFISQLEVGWVCEQLIAAREIALPLHDQLSFKGKQTHIFQSLREIAEYNDLYSTITCAIQEELNSLLGSGVAFLKFIASKEGAELSSLIEVLLKFIASKEGAELSSLIEVPEFYMMDNERIEITTNDLLQAEHMDERGVQDKNDRSFDAWKLEVINGAARPDVPANLLDQNINKFVTLVEREPMARW